MQYTGYDAEDIYNVAVFVAETVNETPKIRHRHSKQSLGSTVGKYSMREYHYVATQFGGPDADELLEETAD